MHVKHTHKFWIIILATAWGLASATAHAQLSEKRRQLQSAQQEMAASKQRSATIQGNLSKLEGELASLSKEVTQIATRLQKNEAELTDIEGKLAILERERLKKRSLLGERGGQLSAMLSTMVRIGHIPQQSAMLMPASFMNKIHASRALSLTSASLKQDMDSLGMQLMELKTLEKKITRKRSEIQTKTAKLEARRAELRDIVVRRKKVMETLYSESASQKQKLANLIQQSNDLQSLVNSLEAEQAKQRESRFAHIGTPEDKPTPPRAQSRSAAPKINMASSPAFKSAKGNMRLPATGSLTGSFGQSRGVNNTLKGIEIATRKRAQVVAPYDGDVLFTGPFMEYGQMVIIRHKDGYHSLLAGFAEVDCVPGQQLAEGEPIGIMGTDIETRRLYMELRQDGKAIDPKPWIADYPLHTAKN